MTQPHAAHATPDTQGADGTPAGHAGPDQGTTPAHVPPAELRAALATRL
ncbi:sugar phosphate isomerase, partial [Streptomyces coelicoflavus]|nr:sugar phosphate isomerase [Streptomyces coelicoflavus]